MISQAARFTWSEFMMNMQSTQRAESVHSAMGGFLTASGLLTTLAEKLDVYKDVARRAETRTFKHQKYLEAQAAASSGHDLVGVVGPKPRLSVFSTVS